LGLVKNFRGSERILGDDEGTPERFLAAVPKTLIVQKLRVLKREKKGVYVDPRGVLES